MTDSREREGERGHERTGGQWKGEKGGSAGSFWEQRGVKGTTKGMRDKDDSGKTKRK